MHGNVWEWVEDCYNDNYNGAPTDGSAWTTARDCTYRIVRGGSWNRNPEFLRSASRVWLTTEVRSNRLGLRVGRTLNPGAALTGAGRPSITNNIHIEQQK
jgi:formylglycine-generating enzyme required for sulfatase activity